MVLATVVMAMTRVWTTPSDYTGDVYADDAGADAELRKSIMRPHVLCMLLICMVMDICRL